MKEIRWVKPLFRWLFILLGALLMLALSAQINLSSPILSHRLSTMEDFFFGTPSLPNNGRFPDGLLPPPGNDSVQRVWVLFGGNAGLALDWLGLLTQVNSPGVGFLLIDYPGYGACEGSASPETIRSSTGKPFKLGREFGLNHSPTGPLWATH